MICPECQCRIGFLDRARSWHPTCVHCPKCGGTFRIVAPARNLFLGLIIALFLTGAAVLGVLTVADFWAGVTGIAGLIALMVFVEFLTYRYYSTHAQLHKI